MTHTKLNVPFITMLDIVRHNLGKNIKDVCPYVFHAICQQESVELKYNRRLILQINTYASAIKRMLVNKNGKLMCYPFKVQASEFVIEKQFQQICEEDAEERQREQQHRTRSSTCTRLEG